MTEFDYFFILNNIPYRTAFKIHPPTHPPTHPPSHPPTQTSKTFKVASDSSLNCFYGVRVVPGASGGPQIPSSSIGTPSASPKYPLIFFLKIHPPTQKNQKFLIFAKFPQIRVLTVSTGCVCFQVLHGAPKHHPVQLGYPLRIKSNRRFKFFKKFKNQIYLFF